MLSQPNHMESGCAANGAVEAAPLRPAVSSFWDVHAYGCVRSTNEVVKAALREGANEGFCATSLEQRGGYGRQGMGQPAGWPVHVVCPAPPGGAAGSAHVELGHLSCCRRCA